MPQQQTVKYFQVVGDRDMPDGSVIHYAVQVDDFLGTPFTSGQPAEEIVQTTAANRQPRGTIAKVTYFSGKTVLLNPTS